MKDCCIQKKVQFCFKQSTMKKSMLSFLIACCCGASIIACQNQQQPASAAVEATTANTAEDSLYKAVMALHDEAMPKMGALMGLQKKAQQKIDSLKTLNQPASLLLIDQLQKLQLQLGSAENGMNEWMSQFNPDPQMPTTEERAKYFADQQAKAQAMRNKIFEVLDSAAVILK